MHKCTILKHGWLKKLKLLVLGSLMGFGATAQTEVPFNRLDFFKNPGKSWSIVGDVSTNLQEKDALSSSKGSGILANIPTKRQKGEDLYSNESFGDMDLEVEYLMAKGSNSGIYLQGMYEIQLLDSWGKSQSNYGDNGGIYERWDDSKPEGQKGYQGYAPRQNTSKAPGLWQHLKVSFQAPKFDESGNKIFNARMLRVELNGVLIHENVELLGPTRGAMFENEVAKGPIRIQGDHGAVAFRNLKITTFDSPKPELFDLAYELYEGSFTELPDLASMEPALTGNSPVLTGNIRNKSKQYLLRYTGKIRITVPGLYSLGLQVPGGGGMMKINGKDAVGRTLDGGLGELELPVGEHEFELVYVKVQDWVNPALGLAISGPGLREVQYSESASAGGGGADPILVDPVERPVLRSFMDIPGGTRVTHAISVGSQEGVHYTYDLDHGNIVQVWRGGFLDATPMWNSRGNGTSRPTGSIQHLGGAAFFLAKLATDGTEWASDSAGTGFKPKGYKVVGKPNHLAYSYQIHGASVEDEVEILSNGQGIKRNIQVVGAGNDLFIRLAHGDTISEMDGGWYLIDDKSFYLQVEGGFKPVLRNVGGKAELIMPASSNISYSLLF